MELPPWADKSPKRFIELHKQALESEYVSSTLHLWVDLVFGYKQRGERAIQHDNLFYPLTYEAPLGEMDEGLEMQVLEFGQTPTQLFETPHPGRNDHAPHAVLVEPPLEEEQIIVCEPLKRWKPMETRVEPVSVVLSRDHPVSALVSTSRDHAWALTGNVLNFVHVKKGVTRRVKLGHLNLVCLGQVSEDVMAVG